MGKFNLNQILNNASRQAAEGGDNPPRPAESEIKKISVFDLVPSEDNFYSMREIEELKAAIEIAGKVLQNLTVVPLDGGKYKVIAGHRRRLASLALVEDGKPQYEFVTLFQFLCHRYSLYSCINTLRSRKIVCTMDYKTQNTQK